MYGKTLSRILLSVDRVLFYIVLCRSRIIRWTAGRPTDCAAAFDSVGRTWQDTTVKKFKKKKQTYENNECEATSPSHSSSGRRGVHVYDEVQDYPGAVARKGTLNLPAWRAHRLRRRGLAPRARTTHTLRLCKILIELPSSPPFSFK